MILENTQWSYDDVHKLGEEWEVRVPLSLVNNPKLSAKAKAVFAYMVSKPEGYQFSSRRIAEAFVEGYRTILGAINELIDAGYIERERLRDRRMSYKLRENYWSLVEKEAEGVLREAFPGMKREVYEYDPVTYEMARERIGDIEAFEYAQACREGEIGMDEMTLEKWIKLRGLGVVIHGQN